MLTNGLGELLRQECRDGRDFFDLFAGSASVSQFVAENTKSRVVAADLQRFSGVLAESVILRTDTLDSSVLWRRWYERASRRRNEIEVPRFKGSIARRVARARSWSLDAPLPITRAYGGHYFSPEQAVWIDCLRVSLPRERASRAAALGALIRAASRCAAAPGHTAQPFQPTDTASRFLEAAWERDVVVETKKFFSSICRAYAHVSGESKCDDAVNVLASAQEGDVAFVDPPYSGVHYSRFYHVLETIAVGECGAVEGVGRYPAQSRRPRSQYSVKSESRQAIAALFDQASTRGVRLVVTFPDHECSNGLSGDILRELASCKFVVREKSVATRFSTLGGTSKAAGGAGSRAARVAAQELILHLAPK